MKKMAAILAVASILCVCASLSIPVINAQPQRVVWEEKDFNYLADAVKFLNQLPAEKSRTAKVLALNSERSGIFNGYYSVVYEK